MPPLPITPATLFRTFARMGLIGFGGVLPWARRVLVDERGWLDDAEFADLLSTGQILPGPNVVNLAMMFGYRHAGLKGGLCAALGLIGPPGLIVLALGLGYRHVAGNALIQGALHGMTAVAAGLIILTAIRLARAQHGLRWPWLTGVAAFVAIALLRWPLLPVLAVLIPTSLAISLWEHRR
ncbi:chromate transporter [Jeongeupia chitinilytica]|uniref:Chromate transporter n=1 Tax=Jeongeupia chitinilytica TaxID=1041641 RepID=A0ABQ3H5Q1_9NEIS|nr:chromate transporter [Jeongeupia chitinilytica]GHD68849.1 chromate transporter [Jeongeupia chitinilytica]